MKNFIQEFKQFAVRGNMIDLAVGIIIGGAFQKIVTSFVNDVVLAALSPVMGRTEDFSKIQLGAVKIGSFIAATLDFLIVAFFVFLLVKAINSLRRGHKKENLSKQEQLLIEIRDLLKK